MGGAKVTKHSPDIRKENMLSQLIGLGKGYCRILLPQIRPEGKVVSSQIAFCTLCRWRHFIAGSSAPISLIRNLFSQNQHKIARTGKQIVMVGRPEVLSQSLLSFRYNLSVVYHIYLNVSEQNCNVYWSKV